MKLIFYVITFLFVIIYSISHIYLLRHVPDTNSTSFTNPDDILFDIQWNLFPLNKLQDKFVDFFTKDNELFKCILPKKSYGKKKKIDSSSSSSKSELELLQPILSSDKCSLRIESYWAFEVCHNKHVRQYHPISISGQKQQQYFLGFSIPYVNMFSKPAQEIQTIKIEGKDYPYFKLDFVGGDYCELIDQKRSVSVLYVCHEGGNGEIQQPQTNYINQIKCFNTNQSVVDLRPKNLIEISEGTEDVKKFIEKTKVSLIQLTQKDIQDFLDQKNCLDITLNGHTYKACYKKYIKSTGFFHEVLWGIYDLEETKLKNQNSEKIPGSVNSLSSSWYTKGDKCEGKKLRSSQLLFKCSQYYELIVNEPDCFLTLEIGSPDFC